MKHLHIPLEFFVCGMFLLIFGSTGRADPWLYSPHFHFAVFHKWSACLHFLYACNTALHKILHALAHSFCKMQHICACIFLVWSRGSSSDLQCSVKEGGWVVLERLLQPKSKIHFLFSLPLIVNKLQRLQIWLAIRRVEQQLSFNRPKVIIMDKQMNKGNKNWSLMHCWLDPLSPESISMLFMLSSWHL